jgi:beta-glucosidase
MRTRSLGVARPPPAAAAGLPYQDPARPVAERVTDLLGRMTLDDKIGPRTAHWPARPSASHGFS